MFILKFILIEIEWGLGIGPNPQSPIPNPQSPIPIFFFIKFYHFRLKIFYNLNIINVKINST